jgi:hypothetical protein
MSPNELRERAERGDLPLEYILEPDGRDGGAIKRGLLSLTFREQMAELGLTKDRLPSEARFNALAHMLRVVLRKAGLPTDSEYVWIRVAGGEWRYDRDNEEDLGNQPYELRSWHDQLIDMTEPLSRYRLIGHLLHEIDQLLRQNLKPQSLEICWRLMNAHWSFTIAIGKVNRWASQGMVAEKCLAKGPESRKTRGTVVLDVVCKHAEKFWGRKAALRGSKTITAEEIASDVNEELTRLGQKPVRPKTIADTISRGISGGLLRTG